MNIISTTSNSIKVNALIEKINQYKNNRKILGV